MKMHFVDFVQVFVDGNIQATQTIGGSGHYEPNIVKKSAESGIRQAFPEAKVTSVIIEHRPVTKEEYAEILGAGPAWLQGAFFRYP